MGLLAPEAIGSGYIKSGAITARAYTNGELHCIASGALAGLDLASGATTRTSLQAGGNPIASSFLVFRPVISNITEEIVSGPVAVHLTQSGTLRIAMASVSGRSPAVGFSLVNGLSGVVLQWSQVGPYQFSSGMADYSGFVGGRLWLGRSGQIVSMSGSWGSGGHASGDVGQPLGIAANSGGAFLNVFPFMTSGGPLGVTAGGTY